MKARVRGGGRGGVGVEGEIEGPRETLKEEPDKERPFLPLDVDSSSSSLLVAVGTVGDELVPLLREEGGGARVDVGVGRDSRSTLVVDQSSLRVETDVVVGELTQLCLVDANDLRLLSVAKSEEGDEVEDPAKDGRHDERV